MEDMWALTGLYLVYYLLLPLGIIFLIYNIWQKRETIKGVTDFGTKEKSAPKLKKEVSEMKKLQISLVILLLLFIPLNNVISHQIQEMSMQYDRMPVGGFGGSVEYRQLKRQLGPSYDTDSIISEMEEAPSAPSHGTWFIEDVREEIDLESLTRFPGKLAVYHLDKSDIGEVMVIIYSYFSPLSITKAFTFTVFEEEAALYHEKTIMYPLDPSDVDPF